MAWRNRGMLALAVAGVMSCAAYGVPRESVTFTNQGCDAPPSGVAPYAFNNFTGGYPARYLKIDGTLTGLLAGTLAGEVVIQVLPPGAGTTFDIQPFTFSDAFGSVSKVVKIPTNIPDAAGTWYFRCVETYNDGTGNDSQWTTLTITLNDGAPASTELGTLGQGHRSRVMGKALATNQVDWYKFTVTADINAGAGTFLDIDTQGSDLINGALHYNDTMVGLYDADGNLIASDDDSGGNVDNILPSRWSQLTFGVGGRPAISYSQPYDGRNGSLGAGTYYLAVSGYAASFNAGWGVASTSLYTGTTQVNIRTNTGAPRAKDLGELSRNPIRLRNISLAAGEVRWYRFDLADNVSAAAGTWLDIDTEGSSLAPSNDTELGLYTSAGNFVTADDDDGTGLWSQVTFGAGTRPPPSTGAAYDGRDGPLPAGTYYLAVCGFSASFNGTGWGVASGSANTGTFSLNIRTNTGDPASCPADLDDGSGSGIPDGGITIDDLLYFLGHYEGGC